MTALETRPEVRVGQIWEGAQSAHLGWRVFVHRLGPRYTGVDVIRPRKGVERFPTEAFPTLFRLLRDVPAPDGPRMCKYCGEVKLADQFRTSEVVIRNGQRRPSQFNVCIPCQEQAKTEGIRRLHRERAAAKQAERRAAIKPAMKPETAAWAETPDPMPQLNGHRTLAEVEAVAAAPEPTPAPRRTKLAAALLDLAALAEQYETPESFKAMAYAVQQCVRVGTIHAGVWVVPAAAAEELFALHNDVARDLVALDA